MGGSQSKEEQLYQAVQNANHTAVKTLRRDGTSLEWADKDGRTPLILACTKAELFDMVITLLNLGASIKAYRPGHHGGYPLHHASKRGLDKTVILLLSRGADPMAVNDDGQTPLDMARNRGHVSVVRILEDRICLFSGALREISGPGFLEALAPQWVTRKIWAVVLPSSSPTRRHSRNELVIYQSPKISLPRHVIHLTKAHIEEPNFNVADPVVALTDRSSKVKFKFLSEFEGRKHQLEKFYRACKGYAQTTSSNGSSPQESVSPAGRCNEPSITILTPKYPPPPPAPPQPQPPVAGTSPSKHTASKVLAPSTKDETIIPEDVALAMAINASLESASAEGIVPPREWRASSPSRNISKGRGSADGSRRSNNLGSWSDSDSSSTMLWGSPEAGPSRVAYDPRWHQQARVSSHERVENIWEARVMMRNHPVRSIPVRDPSAVSVVVQAADLQQPLQRNEQQQGGQQENRRQEQVETAAAAGTVRTSESKFSALFGLKKKAANAGEASKGCAGLAAEEKASGLCVVCWDAPARGVCIPCGHLAGCMNCLQEIKDKSWGCPVCRTSIQQVIKVFTV